MLTPTKMAASTIAPAPITSAASRRPGLLASVLLVTALLLILLASHVARGTRWQGSLGAADLPTAPLTDRPRPATATSSSAALVAPAEGSLREQNLKSALFRLAYH